MEASRSKVFEIIDRIRFYIFPAVFMFCKVNILLFSSLLNIIAPSGGRCVVGRWVGGSVGEWSVGRWLVDWWSVDLIKPFLNTTFFSS